MANEIKTRECPYCKEEIKVNAIKCKHCGSQLSSTEPSHEGTCPYCKETIHPEAVKCKHCHSVLIDTNVGCCVKETEVAQGFRGMSLGSMIVPNPAVQRRPCRWKCFPLLGGGQFCVYECTGDVVILD